MWVDGTFIHFMWPNHKRVAVSFTGKHCSNQWNVMSFWRHLCFKCCSLTVWGKRPVYCSTFCSSCKSLCSCTWLGVSVSLCEVFLPCFHHLFHFSEAWNVAWRSAISALQSCKLQMCCVWQLLCNQLPKKWVVFTTHGTVSWEDRLRSVCKNKYSFSAWWWLQHRLDVCVELHVRVHLVLR